MDDRDILQHLLNVEREAAHLTAEAQAEAEKRVVDRERAAAEAYAAAYGARAAELDREFRLESERLVVEFDARLDEYRAELDRRPIYRERFSEKVREFLFPGAT
jgi:hypothetical protein